MVVKKKMVILNYEKLEKITLHIALESKIKWRIYLNSDYLKFYIESNTHQLLTQFFCVYLKILR